MHSVMFLFNHRFKHFFQIRKIFMFFFNARSFSYASKSTWQRQNIMYSRLYWSREIAVWVDYTVALFKMQTINLSFHLNYLVLTAQATSFSDSVFFVLFSSVKQTVSITWVLHERSTCEIMWLFWKGNQDELT